MPTFETTLLDKELEVSEEAPDMTEIYTGDEFCFIFVVDRSGSMTGQRMDITKQALKLFIQSLPTGCTFSILSFGSNSEFV